MPAQPIQAICLLLVTALSTLCACGQPQDEPAPEQSEKRKKIVFVTGDEEYRSEESMPMLAAILERDYGFQCEVAYSLADDGSVDPNRADHIDGLEALEDADLMVMFTRFRRLPDEELKRITDYVDSGRPAVGFRTATHAFRYPKENPHASAMNNAWPIRIFGQKWITHHGHFADGKESMTEVILRDEGKEHPVLRGVRPFGAYSWLYHVEGGGDALPGNSLRLLTGKAVRSNHSKRFDRFPRTNPVAWTRTHDAGEKQARVFFTTLGHPYDFKQESMRKLALNGILWALGMEDRIPADGALADFARPYDPPNSGFGKVYRKNHFPRRR